MPSSPFVSVVTPVYNDDPYLEECIRSVLSQTHQDFEYIICDNHSTDRSGQIARDYSLQDSRIRVLSPAEFLPQSKNFNFALQQISSRATYVKMLSSDDWLYPECVARLCAVGEQDPNVGLVSSYRLIEELPDCFGVPVGPSVFPGKDALRWQLLGKCFPFGTPSTVLYRADLVRAAAPTFFPENRFYFDLDVAFRILMDHDFGFVHQILSFSRYQPGAIMDQASHLHTWPLMHYVTAAQYGRQLLSPGDFERHYASVEAELYRNLGEAWLKDRVRRRKKAELWTFQRTHLQSIGNDIQPQLLAKGALSAIMRMVAHPGDLLAGTRRSTSVSKSG